MVTVDEPIRGIIGVSAIILLLLLIGSKESKPARGLMGIGALILFLAVVLLAAIAAMVMISSGGSFQQKALITSTETREGISPSLDPVQVHGADATSSGTPHAITRLYVLARLPAGSEPVSLNKTVMKLDTTSSSQTLIYEGTVANGVPATGTSGFVVTYIKTGPYQENGYVNLGDMVNLKMNLDGQLGENMRGRISIIPLKGNMNQIEFITPETMVEPMVIIWPTT